ncbi:uncharacterized protein EAF01_006752 [Botrytis porri]|uniref:uncharacterized protein n=1 Tax=Botrytis porri TaxID=87229 RepID=UPI0018FF7E65|nr:uncharacterized protein EAF01_006752 [Botrytis porri]KAF7903703.1 hypothetical protein EAF01_006752 [Botrytis porri]
MQIPPPQVLSTFPEPNYVDPVTRGPLLLIITAVFLPIVYIVVGLRTFTRIYLSKHFGIDDVFLLIALVPTTVCAVIALIAQERWKWNRHIWDVAQDDTEFGLKISLLLECLFGIAVALTKISLLILVMRVMSRGTGLLKYLAIAMIVLVACEAVAFDVVIINNCSPISDYWKLSYSPQNCIDEQTHLLSSAIINTCSDFFVFFLPIPTVFSLPIPFRQQLMLFLLFAAGLVVCASGVVRIWYIHVTYSSYDRTWFSYPLWISSVLNLYIGIICTALPATKPFFSTFLPSLFGHSNQPSDASLYKSSAHNPSKVRMYPSQNELKRPEESFNIGDMSDPMAEETEIPDYMRKSRQMLPLSYLSSQSSNRRSSLQRSSNPSSYHHQSYQTYDTRDMEFDEASLSIGSYLKCGSARLTQQSDRTYRSDRSSSSTFVTEEPGSPQSSRFSSSLMEVPYTYNQFGRAHELRPSESQDVLIHAR